MAEIDIRATIHADARTIFRYLDDSASWPQWTPIERFELVSPAGPDGLGEVRRFHTGRVTVVEEIVERVPERRLSYTLLEGLAVRDYRADIDLAPAADATELRWHTTFRSTVPGMGWLYRRALDKATRQFVDGLTRRTQEAALQTPA